MACCEVVEAFSRSGMDFTRRFVSSWALSTAAFASARTLVL